MGRDLTALAERHGAFALYRWRGHRDHADWSQCAPRSCSKLPAAQLDRTVNRELPVAGASSRASKPTRGDQIVAYYILPDAPDLAFSMIGPAVRVPADDVLHIFQMKFPGQRRGISELAPVLTRLHELEKFQDALAR